MHRETKKAPDAGAFKQISMKRLEIKVP